MTHNIELPDFDLLYRALKEPTNSLLVLLSETEILMGLHNSRVMDWTRDHSDWKRYSLILSSTIPKRRNRHQALQSACYDVAAWKSVRDERRDMSPRTLIFYFDSESVNGEWKTNMFKSKGL